MLQCLQLEFLYRVYCILENIKCFGFATLSWQLPLLVLRNTIALVTTVYFRVEMLCILYTDGCSAEVTTIPSQENEGINVSLSWPESDLGQNVTIDCPCGNFSFGEEVQSTASRYCGGSFSAGAMWAEPQDELCNFTETTRRLCLVIEVCIHKLPCHSINCRFTFRWETQRKLWKSWRKLQKMKA